MSGEIIAIVTVGLTLAGLLVGLFAWLRADMIKGEERLRADMVKGEERLESQITGVRGEITGVRGEVHGLRGEVVETRAEVSQLRERMAHLEGLLEGIRDFVTGRAATN